MPEPDPDPKPVADDGGTGTGIVEVLDESEGSSGVEIEPIPPSADCVPGLDGRPFFGSMATLPCAVEFDGSVQCWGESLVAPPQYVFEAGNVPVRGVDQVAPMPGGDGFALTTAGVVVRYSGFTVLDDIIDTSVRQIAAGSDHVCMLRNEGTVACVGSNVFDQLGAISTADEPHDVDLPGLALQVTAGDGFSCALLDDGSVWCWGRNSQLQLGSNVRERSTPEPQRVALGALVHTIVAGREHACAWVTGGEVYCWGSDAAGQLGSSSPQPGPQPPVGPFLGLTEIRDVSAGGDHTCILDASGGMHCAGDIDQVETLASRTDSRHLASGDGFACVRNALGAIRCAGRAADRGSLPVFEGRREATCEPEYFSP